MSRGQVALVFCALFLGVASAQTSLTGHFYNQKETSSQMTPQPNQTATCSLYIAPSTIPDAGLGVFSAMELQTGTLLTSNDPVIPLLSNDIDLLKDYTLPGRLVDDEAKVGFALGLSSLLNADSLHVNVAPLFAQSTSLDVQHPSHGAHTNYHSLTYRVTSNIAPHTELLEHYGHDWFQQRPQFQHVPLLEDYDHAQELLQVWVRLQPVTPTQLHQKMYQMMRATSSTRLQNALPATYEHALQAARNGLETVMTSRNQRDSIPPQGRCLDSVSVAESTLGGLGAFAKQHYAEGDLITGSPLLHIVNGTNLVRMSHEIWNTDNHEYTTVTDEQPQLLLNYCFGHAKSTLLLCPYSSSVGAMNHNHETPNVGVRWAPQGHLSHNEDLVKDATLNGLSSLDRTSLALDYYALREIKPGDELVLDYGAAWEKAWQEHVKEWKGKTANDFNKDRQLVLKTQEEQQIHPYPPNVEMRCHPSLVSSYTSPDVEWADKNGEPIEGYECDVLERYIEGGQMSYMVLIKLGNHRRQQLPAVLRKFIRFADRATEQLHHRNAFRHPMHLPDDVFPEQWRDLN